MTIELTEEDAAILRELIAERKHEIRYQKLKASRETSLCKHGLNVWKTCPDCKREHDWVRNLNHL